MSGGGSRPGSPAASSGMCWTAPPPSAPPAAPPAGTRGDAPGAAAGVVGGRARGASVCSGGLLLGDAGFLRGLAGTTHWSAYAALRPLCGEVVTDRRVVDTGRVITAGAVSSSLDLGLHLVGRFFGADERARV